MTQPWVLMTREERLALLLSAWRTAIPALLILGSMLIMVLPVFLPGPTLPHLPLLGVYYWSTHRPNLLPAWAAFLIGLAVDIVLGMPLGLNALLFVLIRAGLGSQITAFLARPYIFGLAVAAPVILLFQVMTWTLLLPFEPRIGLTPFLVQAATTLAAWPLMTRLCALAQTRLVDKW